MSNHVRHYISVTPDIAMQANMAYKQDFCRWTSGTLSRVFLFRYSGEFEKMISFYFITDFVVTSGKKIHLFISMDVDV